MTLNNDYFLINLKQKDMAIARSGPKEKFVILYGIQQVSSGIFCTIIKKKHKHGAKMLKNRIIMDVD